MSLAAGRAGADLPLSGDADFALRLFIITILAVAVGAEREFHGHPAGIRTMALVGVGACMFTALGLEPLFSSRTDPTRIAAQLVTGIGFLGAGAILRNGNEVRGLTTAASIWVVAAIGMCIGFGFYFVGIFTTALVMVTLVVIRPIEWRLFRRTQARRDAGKDADLS
jgi:putative Mg2+ transporter-C (MgtC) family protein